MYFMIQQVSYPNLVIIVHCVSAEVQMSTLGTKCLDDGVQRKDRLYVCDFFLPPSFVSNICRRPRDSRAFARATVDNISNKPQ